MKMKPETAAQSTQTELKNQNPAFAFENRNNYLPWLLMSAAVLLTIFILHWQGRIWWCKWDNPSLLWSSDAWSKHSSQHLFDPYSFTHVLHGLIFYAAARLIFRGRLSFNWLLLFAVSVESVWEILENSKAVIERYRAATVSLDYFGDSVANSFGDILSCAVGFLLARKLAFRYSLLLFAVIETILIFTIRDSLLINILMLIYPIEWIKMWQTGG